MEVKILEQEATEAIKKSQSLKELEEIRVNYLGKNSAIMQAMQSLKLLPPEEKKNFGQKINSVKEAIQTAITYKKEQLEEAALQEKLASEKIDVTLPVRPEKKGSVHPISQVTEEIITIFHALGFKVAEGPEIEDEYYNFTALNIAEHHPARQMHDSFYLPEKGKMLRTHTSNVQIRVMEKEKPPIRIIAPGRVYRSDYDMTHSPMFHQVEGLLIDKKVNMGHLKYCIGEFLRLFFGKEDIALRFRPSFFPFTEPSAEVDIEFNIGWLEILGCGMVHPNVLKSAGIDTEIYSGFAFGMGIERLAMLKYGINDLRRFFDGDERWLNHYSFSALDIPNLVKGAIR